MSDIVVPEPEAPAAQQTSEEIVHPSQGIISEAPKPETKEQEAEAPASPEPEVKAEETKEEVKPEGEAKKDDDPSSPKPTWEEEKAVMEKRLKDTQAWANKTNQKAAEQERLLAEQAKAIEILNKKVEGTWTEADEAAEAIRRAEAEKVTLAQQTVSARLEGALYASKEAAATIYGPKLVDEFLESPVFHGMLEDPIIKQIIAQSDAPIVKAMDLADRMAFDNHYGTKPADIYSKIFKEAEAKLRPQIEKEIKDSLSRKKELPKGLGDVPNEVSTATSSTWDKAQEMEYLRKTRAGSYSS